MVPHAGSAACLFCSCTCGKLFLVPMSVAGLGSGGCCNMCGRALGPHSGAALCQVGMSQGRGL